MKIAESDASILLSDDGRANLSTVEVEVDSLSWIDVDVVESEDLGLWIRVERDSKPGLLLVRWEYILAVEVIARPRVATVFGLKG
jgi:hypothetical protein